MRIPERAKTPEGVRYAAAGDVDACIGLLGAGAGPERAKTSEGVRFAAAGLADAMTSACPRRRHRIPPTETDT